SAPSLASFGKHWQDWYYDLTRDERVITRIREYMEAEEATGIHTKESTFAAFLYHATGEDRWLKPLVAPMHDATLNIYDNPGDRYHLYSLAQSNPAAMLLGRLPFYLHALDKAGLRFAH